MEDYISYLDIIHRIRRIHAGDTICLISNISRLMKVASDHGESFSCDQFIDSILECIGSEGTLLIPAFNWDFCKGVPFDYYHTRSRTGVLGDAAVKRQDFERTMHPLYSFAVCGKDKEMILGLDIENSFGEGTVFSYFEKTKAKALVIDLNSSAGMTYYHHIEQKTGVPYRYQKIFYGQSAGKDGKKRNCACSMYVRDLEKAPQALTDYTVINGILENLNISQTQYFNSIPFRTVYIAETEPVIWADILFSDSRNLYKYHGQKKGLLDE